VLKAVEFNGTFCCRTIEIEVVNADRMLAAKLESGEAPGTHQLGSPREFSCGLAALSHRGNRIVTSLRLPNPKR
jgi:hypothetical protein